LGWWDDSEILNPFQIENLFSANQSISPFSFFYRVILCVPVIIILGNDLIFLRQPFHRLSHIYSHAAAFTGFIQARFSKAVSEAQHKEARQRFHANIFNIILIGIAADADILV
jgi:hypothetical protein